MQNHAIPYFQHSKDICNICCAGLAGHAFTSTDIFYDFEWTQTACDKHIIQPQIRNYGSHRRELWSAIIARQTEPSVLIRVAPMRYSQKHASHNVSACKIWRAANYWSQRIAELRNSMSFIDFTWYMLLQRLSIGRPLSSWWVFCSEEQTIQGQEFKRVDKYH